MCHNQEHVALPLYIMRELWRTLYFFAILHGALVESMLMSLCFLQVFFLTDGGSHLYQDPRRNSLAAAIELCMSSECSGAVPNMHLLDFIHEAKSTCCGKCFAC
jgi:hypothetical protein